MIDGTEEEKQLALSMSVELSKGEHIHIELEPAHAFALIGTIQLATRHRGFNGPTAQWAADFARDLQAKLSEGRPTVAEICEKGWDQFFDA